MNSISLLSNEVSKARALAAGGAQIREIHGLLKKWMHSLPAKGRRRGSESMLLWARNLTDAMASGERLGVPAAKLLSEIHPMIRREERLWMRLTSLEKQYGLQGAIATVLPWIVVALIGGLRSNIFTFVGAFMQFIGMAAFYLVIRHATKKPESETLWLRDMMTAVWMRVLCGQTLWTSVQISVTSAEIPRFRLKAYFCLQWKEWFRTFETGNAVFEFNKKFTRSAEAGTLICALVKSGAPSADALADWICQLDEECHQGLEERISSVPTSLSLIFCFFLTPAVFLILTGALWPMLSKMM